MKKIIPCLIGGIVLGAGGMLGVTQIPSVNSALMNDSNSSFEDISLEAENSDLKLNNSILKEDVNRLNSELSECNSLIKQKDETIASQVTRINDLNTQISSLQSELDNYKNSPGDGADYFDIISNLQSQLDLKTSELNTATAELEQLRVDKTSLETRVQELETELDVVLEELKKFKDNENIDALNVSSYNGTWYLNGTFEKVYTIKDGVVTLNSNEDSGVVNCLYNQMYLFMNTNGSLAVNLSQDGNSFETANGEVYKRFYTNTTETIVSDLSSISGVYSSGNIQLTLNNDNTLIYADGDVSLYGSYVCSSVLKNVGGNKSVINYITVNIVNGEDHILKHFEYTSDSEQIYNIDDDAFLQKVNSLSNYILCSSGFEIPSDNYIKITLKAKDYIKLDLGSSAYLNMVVAQTQVNYSVCKINGVSLSTPRYLSGIYHTGIESKSFVIDNSYYTRYFDFYLTDLSSSYYNYLKDFHSIRVNDTEVLVDIIDVDVVNTNFVPSFIKNYINSSNKTYNYMHCSPVNDYIDGTYSNGALSINIDNNVSTITYAGSDSITASNVTVSSKTDGYDIYQDVVITYSRLEMVGDVEKEVAHTITLTFKNDSLTSSLLDNELLEL